MIAASSLKDIRRYLLLIFSVKSTIAAWRKKMGMTFATPFTSPPAGFYSVQVTLQCRLFPAEFLELWCSLSWLKGGKATQSLNQSRIWSVKFIPKRVEDKGKEKGLGRRRDKYEKRE